MSYFNASEIAVSAAGDLTLGIVTARGQVVYRASFPPNRRLDGAASPNEGGTHPP